MSRPAGTYAIFETSQGNIVARLLEQEAPKTVANFVGLAEGTKEFTNEKTGQKEKRPFYDGLIFHRVIPQFMIQGGCPHGSMQKRDCFPWPTPARIPTAASFSLRWRRRRGSTTGTRFLEKSWRVRT